MRPVKILIVSPPALARLIRHLFDSQPELEVLGSLEGLKSLTYQSARNADLIIGAVKPVGAGVCATALAIKEASPWSKLILICPVGSLGESARRCGADACLDQEQLVGRLLPAVRAILKSGGPKHNSRPTFSLRCSAPNSTPPKEVAV